MIEILRYINHISFRIEKIVIWSNKDLLSKLPENKLIEKVHYEVFEKNLVFRTIWQFTRLRLDAENKSAQFYMFPEVIICLSFLQLLRCVVTCYLLRKKNSGDMDFQ